MRLGEELTHGRRGGPDDQFAARLDAAGTEAQDNPKPCMIGQLHIVQVENDPVVRGQLDTVDGPLQCRRDQCVERATDSDQRVDSMARRGRRHIEPAAAHRRRGRSPRIHARLRVLRAAFRLITPLLPAGQPGCARVETHGQRANRVPCKRPEASDGLELSTPSIPGRQFVVAAVIFITC
jgi:hypothetical protein